jgi:hypothetical protein
MDRSALTPLYLDEVRRQGVSPAGLLRDVASSERVLLNAFHPGAQYLTRPLFAGHEEVTRLYSDVETVRSLLVSLPGRLYDGDFAAFARAAGASGYQLQALLASRSDRVSPQARADLHEDAAGFRVMEFNPGSALGGMENADICRVMLQAPVLARFAAEHGLGFVDTQREQVANLYADTGLRPGSAPVVAVTDWPTSYAGVLGPYMHKLAARWTEMGLDAHACHIGELAVRGGRVWLAGRAVDIVARMFMLDYLLEPGAAELMDPVLGAVARGEVAMYTPLDCELYGSKGALAMLSDERNRHLFTAEELASLDAIVPWTRPLRPGAVTLEDGQVVDLVDYALGRPEDLVIKPTLRYGGLEVLAGWQAGLTPELWRERLTKALGGPYVLQRRIRPVSEPFPAEDGTTVPWVVVWGVFTGVNGFGGIFTRGGPAGSGPAVLNLHGGAHIGCCLTGTRP